MNIFYKTFVQSILTYNFICWYGSLTVQNRNKLFKIVNTAGKICGLPFENLTEIYERQSMKKLHKIMNDSTHYWHYEFQYLPSARRLRLPFFKSNRARQSYIPTAIRLYNGNEMISNLI